MKLYKFDYKGTIGNNVITVPTDSQFFIGIGNGDAEATVQLFDGSTTEILPEDNKIGEYTCFRFETNGTPFRKPYKAVISGNKDSIPYTQTLDLTVICRRMSVAYRDLEGSGSGGITPEEIVETVSESGLFLEKKNNAWDATSATLSAFNGNFRGNVIFAPTNPNTQSVTVQGKLITTTNTQDLVSIDVSRGNIDLHNGSIVANVRGGESCEFTPINVVINDEPMWVLASPIES